MTQALEAKKLEKSYRGRKIVRGVSVQVKFGEVVGLLGPNGAGKTTTFYMVVGLIKPDQGRVVLDGTDITRMPMYQRARNGIGYLPQEPSVFRKLSVAENLMAVLETMNLSWVERQERKDILLKELGISHLADSKAYTLSGGSVDGLRLRGLLRFRRSSFCLTSRLQGSIRSQCRTFRPSSRCSKAKESAS